MSLLTRSLITNPIPLITIQRLTIALLVAFTSPKSVLRLAPFPIFVLWNAYLLPRYYGTVPRLAWIAMIAGEAVFALLHYIEKILLRQRSFETDRHLITAVNDDGKLGGQQPSEKALKRLRYGLWVAFSDRYIASPDQAPNTPPYLNSNPSYIPSRRNFIFRKIFLISSCYLTIDVLSQLNDPALNATNYAPSQIPFFSRLLHGELTAEELFIRVTTSLGFWFAGTWFIQLYFSALSLLAVILGVSRPELERPFFGNASEAYTLRGHWGKFWHQLLRCRLTTPADWITDDVLGLTRLGQRGRLVRRYTHLFIVFAVSGLGHLATDVAQGVPWAESGAIVFFVLMAVGITMEDFVQWLFFDVVGIGKRGNAWAKVVGFVWVAMWFGIATPWYAYPTLVRNQGEEKDVLLPVSVVEYLRKA